VFNIKISDLKAAKKQSGENTQKREEELNLVYKEALQSFRTFILSSGSDKNSLKQAIEKFNAALALKKQNAGPYFYLSYIFYICGDLPQAKKYLKIAKLIAPEFEGLNSLEKRLQNC
jgi:tetratricopeptide (TPR) repeat protein